MECGLLKIQLRTSSPSRKGQILEFWSLFDFVNVSYKDFQKYQVQMHLRRVWQSWRWVWVRFLFEELIVFRNIISEQIVAQEYLLACDCDATVVGWFPTSEHEIFNVFIYSLWFKTKGAVVFRRSTRNTSRIGRKWVTDMS